MFKTHWFSALTLAGTVAISELALELSELNVAFSTGDSLTLTTSHFWTLPTRHAGTPTQINKKPTTHQTVMSANGVGTYQHSTIPARTAAMTENTDGKFDYPCAYPATTQTILTTVVLVAAKVAFTAGKRDSTIRWKPALHSFFVYMFVCVCVSMLRTHTNVF